MDNNIVLMSLNREELQSLIKQAVEESLNRKKEKELLTFRETCDLLNISASALNKYKAEGVIPYKKVGKRVLFSRSEILAALKDSDYKKLRELK